MLSEFARSRLSEAQVKAFEGEVRYPYRLNDVQLSLLSNEVQVTFDDWERFVLTRDGRWLQPRMGALEQRIRALEGAVRELTQAVKWLAEDPSSPMTGAGMSVGVGSTSSQNVSKRN